MKKILFPAAFAIAMAFAATDASAQQVVGSTSGSDRPMPTNNEITGDQQREVTNGQPYQQIRANETDSERNRENMEVIKKNPEEKASRQGDPAMRVEKKKARKSSRTNTNNSSL